MFNAIDLRSDDGVVHLTALEDQALRIPRRRLAVQAMRVEQVAAGPGIGIALTDAVLNGDRSSHRVCHSVSRLTPPRMSAGRWPRLPHTILKHIACARLFNQLGVHASSVPSGSPASNA